MHAIAAIAHVACQTSDRPRQTQRVVRCAHHLENRRPHEYEKGNERGNGIAGQGKDGAVATPPEQERLARFNCDSPQIDFGTEFFQERSNQIVVADRHAAADD